MRSYRNLFIVDAGLDIEQFRLCVVRPTLEYLDKHNASAENLVLGTALVESRLRYLKQLNDGPARGVCQMEPNTLDDIYENYLAYRPELRQRADALRDARPTTNADELIYNLAYAVAMCRIHYLRVPVSLPQYDDALGLACYWKSHYNTGLGAGTVEHALPYFQQVAE